MSTAGFNSQNGTGTGQSYINGEYQEKFRKLVQGRLADISKLTPVGEELALAAVIRSCFWVHPRSSLALA